MSSTNDTPVENAMSNLQISPEEAGGEDELSQAVVNRLVALKQIHNEVEEVNEEYKKQRAALEKQYELLRAPIWQKRKDIVSGAVEVELEDSESVPEPESGEDKDKETGIPGFWYQCIANHPAIGSQLAEDDLGALEALTDITCEYNDDYSGFKLVFSFRENDFFTNKELTKSYVVAPDLLEEKAPALTSVDGTKIDWKHKKNLCMTETKKKQKAKSGRKAGQIRFVTKLEAKQSFFHFFSDPRLDDEEDEDEDEDEGGGNKEGEHEFQLSIDEDYEIGHAFRAELIPDAILWFTGEAMEEEDEDEDDVDYAEGEDDEDDEDEDEDEEDGPAAGSVPAGGAGEQPECKQS